MSVANPTRPVPKSSRSPGFGAETERTTAGAAKEFSAEMTIITKLAMRTGVTPFLPNTASSAPSGPFSQTVQIAYFQR
jgi:hypothetical protein